MGDKSDELSSVAGARRERGTLFHASPPAVLFGTDLGASAAVYDPSGRYARRAGWLLPVALVLGTAIITAHPNPNSRRGATLYGFALAPLILAVLFLSARRAYEAVGPGWVYVRRTPFGAGRLTRFDRLTSVDVVSGRRRPLTLVLRDGRTRIQFMDRRFQINGAEFARQLARGVLQSNATVSPEALAFLSKYPQT